MPRRLAKPAWRCARFRAAFRFLVWRRARLASPRSGFYLCSCQLVLSLGIRFRNSSQPDHPMLSLRAKGDLVGNINLKVCRAVDGTSDGKEQMLMFGKIHDRADIESGVCASADFHRGAMIHFGSDQNIFRDLPLHDHAPEAPVLIARSGIDAVAAAAVNRPVANTLLQPQRQEC